MLFASASSSATLTQGHKARSAVCTAEPRQRMPSSPLQIRQYDTGVTTYVTNDFMHTSYRNAMRSLVMSSVMLSDPVTWLGIPRRNVAERSAWHPKHSASRLFYKKRKLS